MKKTPRIPDRSPAQTEIEKVRILPGKALREACPADVSPATSSWRARRRSPDIRRAAALIREPIPRRRVRRRLPEKLCVEACVKPAWTPPSAFRRFKPRSSGDQQLKSCPHSSAGIWHTRRRCGAGPPAWPPPRSWPERARRGGLRAHAGRRDDQPHSRFRFDKETLRRDLRFISGLGRIASAMGNSRMSRLLLGRGFARRRRNGTGRASASGDPGEDRL